MCYRIAGLILEIKYPLAPGEGSVRELFNKEIRHNYGYTVANFFRDWFAPDYAEIVRGTAEKLKINVKNNSNLGEIEIKIIEEVIANEYGSKVAIISTFCPTIFHIYGHPQWPLLWLSLGQRVGVLAGVFIGGDTNWEKTISSVVAIAMLRRKHGFA